MTGTSRRIPVTFCRDVQAAEYQDGSLILTNHRILWRDAVRPVDNSISLSLSLSGFLKSSPKVTLFLLPKCTQSPFHPACSITSEKTVNSPQPSFWTCTICSERNTTDKIKCGICGVPRPQEKLAPKDVGWDCHICTFVNKSVLQACEMCGTPRLMPRASPELTESVSEGGDDYIRLSFRGTYERREERVFDPSVGGVAGLLKRVNISQQDTDANLSVAFNDLDSLMSKASEMVKLAESVSNKLANKSDSVDEQTERDFRNLLLEMGVAGAVTKETTGNSFTKELSRQLGDFIFRLLERRKSPMLPLADVYCLYNRARGTNLVSPEDLFRAASLMSDLSMPVELCKLPSGLLVVQSRDQTDAVIMRTVKSLIVDELDCVDALAVSRKANMTLSISILYLEKSEKAGILCRDDSPSGVKYYLNCILSPTRDIA
ncbi:hypothetical protein PSACC_01609 [Paramicrosporidium saccamoebae]|uniref:Vacuolar protein-sorting-associated protein 36 n=1 Tax=Paramicrosporidium saccamoebae TaxID=1246581 RepID=A0A2H9TLP4_9FUNG|nr:hypothetical protein PSACC_01609 [Paramicrosporidium saccamoebae]